MIIATDRSGVRDSLDSGKYGKIVPPADANALREALREVLADIASYTSRAADGREYLLEYMDANAVAEQYIEIYKTLVLNR